MSLLPEASTGSVNTRAGTDGVVASRGQFDQIPALVLGDAG
jgi:hypothetical protein